MASETLHKVAEQVLTMTRDLIHAEPNVTPEIADATPTLYQWEPLEPSALQVPLELKHIRLSHSLVNPAFQVVSVQVGLPAQELDLVIERNTRYDFDQDPFAPDVMEAVMSYLVHPHDLCLSAFESAEAAKRDEKQRVSVAERSGMHDGQSEKGYTVTDKRPNYQI